MMAERAWWIFQAIEREIMTPEERIRLDEVEEGGKKLCPHRLGRPRTPGFHPGNRGSNPLGDAFLSNFLCVHKT